MTYWDTSCVIKLYTAESDSAVWDSHAATGDHPLISSAILDIEFAFGLYRKESQGDLVEGGADALIRLFHADIKSGRILLYPMGADVRKSAAELARRCYAEKPSIHLRTLDGLHLATAQLAKCNVMATTDQRLREAAHFAGLRCLS